MTDEIIKLRIGKQLFEAMVTQASYPTPVTIEWGEPDDEGFYEPIVYTHDPSVKELMGE